MRQLSPGHAPPFDFWGYVEIIPAADFVDHTFDGGVSYVWQDSPGKFQHVLLDSEDKNIFMAIVLDLCKGEVLGHRLLNLNELYDINER